MRGAQRRGHLEALEKDDFTAGSTWHAAGLWTQFNSSLNVTRLLMRGVELFRELDSGSHGPIDFREVGSLRLATVPARLDQYRNGGEPVYARDGLAGYLRAAHPGHAVGRTIGFAYLPAGQAVPGTALEVEILGERRSAVVVTAPLYDREGGRMRM